MKKTNRPPAQFTKATYAEGAIQEESGQRLRLLGRFTCPLCSEALAIIVLTDSSEAQGDVIAAQCGELMEMFKATFKGQDEGVSDKRFAQMAVARLKMGSDFSLPMAPRVVVSKHFQRSASDRSRGEFIRAPKEVPYSQTRIGERRVSYLAHAAAKVSGPDVDEFAEKHRKSIENIKTNPEVAAQTGAMRDGTTLYHSEFLKRGAIFHCCECTCEIAPHQVLKLTAKEWGRC